MSGTPAGWDAYLDPGERVLWQGRPDGAVSFRGLDLRQTIFGAVFLGFAIFWTLAAASSLTTDDFISRIFPLFGLLFVFQGLRLVGGDRLWNAYVRRRSWYTLTDRRAFIATRILGRRALSDWPITAASLLDLEGGPPDTIWFAERRRRAGRKRRRVGFERIADAQEVLRLMRQIQQGQPGRTGYREIT